MNATCPQCGSEVIAKCGSIKAWHWAHKADDCDIWQEPMTDWHWNWQGLFPEDSREVVITKRCVSHRADVVTGKTVIEFQHSSISPDEIWERESFYGRMIWVFDAIDAVENNRLILRPKDGYYTFRWKWARTSIPSATKDVYLDVGNNRLLELRKMGITAPVGGWGNLITWKQFVGRFR